MKRILVAVDFTDATPEVIAAAVRMAKAFESEIYVVHVAEPDPEFVGYEAGPPSVRTAEARHLQDEHRRVHEIAEKLRGEGLKASGHLLQGSTVQSIIDEVEKLEAELIVIGNHPHGLMHRFFLGSVTEGVIRRNRCPVLVVPGKP